MPDLVLADATEASLQSTVNAFQSWPITSLLFLIRTSPVQGLTEVTWYRGSVIWTDSH